MPHSRLIILILYGEEPERHDLLVYYYYYTCILVYTAAIKMLYFSIENVYTQKTKETDHCKKQSHFH
jgi:hypothetical protein